MTAPDELIKIIEKYLDGNCDNNDIALIKQFF